ncbi:carbon-nitrogen hydrolase [archaeon SCG-AAA382B04]|nr:carbon-nitrogen hydrolase [archaeon SCG-AAA382B04]
MKIKTIQFSPTDGQKDKNLDKIKKIFLKQNFENVDLVVLPELWSTGVYFEKFIELSEKIPGKTTKLLSDLANQNNILLCGGSIVEKNNQNIYNTLTFFDREGDLKEKYRKIHLFSYTNEDQYLSPGKKTKTIETEFGKIGLSTCYDLRFPEQYRKMAQQGAQIFVCPAAWPEERKDHWKIFNQARAIENQSYLISCNRRGKYDENNFIGNSYVIGPSGKIIKKETNKRILTTNIDLKKIKETRENFPTLKDYKKIT